MMGAGKSTLGRLLARHLDFAWLDTDACVGRRTGMPVQMIFETRGEQFFREAEWECVRQTIAMHDVVVSCGGGAPCHLSAMDLMLASGHVIYLKASAETLISRLQNDSTERPLSSAYGSLLDTVPRLLMEREPVYLRAHRVIDTDQLLPEDVLRMLVDA